MSNKDKYDKIFKDTFEIEQDMLKGLEYNQIEAWDSIGHMELIAEFEDEWEIIMEMDDIIEISSYENGKEILKRYEVDFK